MKYGTPATCGGAFFSVIINDPRGCMEVHLLYTPLSATNSGVVVFYEYRPESPEVL